MVRKGIDSEKPASSSERSVVLASRDYSDTVHLENPGVIEQVLSKSRAEAIAYVGALLQSALPKYVLAGPKVAFTAMVMEALTDFWKEVSAWRKAGRFPEDFSGRQAGYQAWVELLSEIDSNPVDKGRLKALKAMFLAANKPGAGDGEQILAYQLFQIAKKLSSGDLLVLKAAFANQGTGHDGAQNWLAKIANFLGHGVTALIGQHERVLVDNGLLSPRFDQNLRVDAMNGRLTDLGMAFCRNIQSYDIESKPT